MRKFDLLLLRSMDTLLLKQLLDACKPGPVRKKVIGQSCIGVAAGKRLDKIPGRRIHEEKKGHQREGDDGAGNIFGVVRFQGAAERTFYSPIHQVNAEYLVQTKMYNVSKEYE